MLSLLFCCLDSISIRYKIASLSSLSFITMIFLCSCVYFRDTQIDQPVKFYRPTFSKNVQLGCADRRVWVGGHGGGGAQRLANHHLTPTPAASGIPLPAPNATYPHAHCLCSGQAQGALLLVPLAGEPWTASSVDAFWK